MFALILMDNFYRYFDCVTQFVDVLYNRLIWYFYKFKGCFIGDDYI